jgi:hypothetical protein
LQFREKATLHERTTCLSCARQKMAIKQAAPASAP